MKAVNPRIEIKLFLLSCLLMQVFCEENTSDRLKDVEEQVNDLKILVQSIGSSCQAKVEKTMDEKFTELKLYIEATQALDKAKFEETKELLSKEREARIDADEKIKKETKEQLSKVNKMINSDTGILRRSCKQFQRVGGLSSKKSHAQSYMDFGIRNQFYEAVQLFVFYLTS